MSDDVPQAKPKPPLAERMKQCWESWEWIRTPLALISLILAVSVTYIAFLNSRVRSIVKDPDFITAVAQQTSPSLVFDGEGRIISDSGALALLQEPPGVVKLVPGAEEGSDPQFARITIKPKEAQGFEPIIQSLDYGNVAVIAKRGPGISWIIEVNARTLSGAVQNEDKFLSPPRFRLELVR